MCFIITHICPNQDACLQALRRHSVAQRVCFCHRLFFGDERRVGISPQTRSLRSCGSIRSRSTSELLLDSKRPSFLVSRRFAWDTPTPCSHEVSRFVLSRKNFLRVAPDDTSGVHFLKSSFQSLSASSLPDFFRPSSLNLK